MNKWIIMIICIFIPLVVGWLSSFSTMNAVDDWYKTINKPSFNPPSFIFGPVWTVLYILMGISLYLVWMNQSKGLWKWAIAIFAVQLFLNFAWSILFFGMHNPLLAFIDIILLWIAIVVNIILFWKINPYSGMLLIPYLLWVSFASVLNFFIMILN